jgi:hypothetical protein
MDDVLELLLPQQESPEVREQRAVIAYNELARENKELTISLYVVCGLVFLLFLMRR